jgi:hypothetical protein
MPTYPPEPLRQTTRFIPRGSDPCFLWTIRAASGPVWRHFCAGSRQPCLSALAPSWSCRGGGKRKAPPSPVWSIRRRSTTTTTSLRTLANRVTAGTRIYAEHVLETAILVFASTDRMRATHPVQLSPSEGATYG